MHDRVLWPHAVWYGRHRGRARPHPQNTCFIDGSAGYFDSVHVRAPCVALRGRRRPTTRRIYACIGTVRTRGLKRYKHLAAHLQRKPVLAVFRSLFQLPLYLLGQLQRVNPVNPCKLTHAHAFARIRGEPRGRRG